MVASLGDTKDKVLEDARKAVAGLAAKVAHQTMVALDKTDEEVIAGMDADAKTAPMWVHLLSKLSASMVKAQLTDPPAPSNNLSITVIGKAENTEAWLEMTKPFQRQVESARKKDAIDIAVVEKEKVEAKK